MKRPSFSATTAGVGLGLLSAACYAAQHPFQKPLLTNIEGSTDAITIAVIWGEVVGVAVILLMFWLKPAMRLSTLSLIKERTNWINLLVLAVLGSISLVVFFLSLRNFNAVTVSIYANLFPMWFVLVGWLLFKKEKPDNVTLGVLIGVALAILVTDTLTSGNTPKDALVQFLVLSIVPVLFSINTWYQERAFPTVDVYVFVAVVYVIDAPAFITAALVYKSAFGSGGGVIIPDLGFPAYAAFIVGAGVSGYLARYFLQEAIRANEAASDYVAVPFFLIPMMVGGYAWLLAQLGLKSDNRFTSENEWVYVVFAVGFLAFFVAKHSSSAKKKS